MRWRTVGSQALLAGMLIVAPGIVLSPTDALAQPKPGQPSKPDKGQPSKPDKGGGPIKPGKNLSDKQKKEEAKKRFKDAEDKFGKSDYAGAVLLYQEADEFFPHPKNKQRVALCYDKMGKVKDAVSWYEKFLGDNPDPEKLKADISDGKARLEALKKTPAKVKVTTDPAAPAGLKLAVDGAAQPGPELNVPPGKHKITASADGYAEAAADLEVSFADTKDVTIKLEKAAAPPVAAAAPPSATPAATSKEPPPKEPEKPAEPRSNVPAYVTLGLAGAGVVVGTIFGVMALGAKSDFDDNPTTDNADKVDRDALIADMSFAVALTFGVTGTVLLLSNGKSDDAKPAAAARRTFVTPYVAPTGGGAAARFTF